jgi:TRAP-type C4-dicarboxylate transport system permease small subunit
MEMVAWRPALKFPQAETPRRDEMSAIKIAALVLIVAGALGLLYGTFSYTKETHRAQLGALELTVKDRETVNIPAWVGVAAIVAGGLLLVTRKGKS